MRSQRTGIRASADIHALSSLPKPKFSHLCVALPDLLPRPDSIEVSTQFHRFIALYIVQLPLLKIWLQR